jgi:hypothetical protein
MHALGLRVAASRSRAAMVQEASLKKYARGVLSYFFSRAPRALKIWQINSAILKVPDAVLIR